MNKLILTLTALLFASAPAAAEPDPVMVHVIVPLCHNGQIDCGSDALGDPDNLRTNLYWGALYGARRMFERKRFGYEKVAQARTPKGVLERAVFRRHIDGVEHLTVLDAIDGNRIDDAVVRFFRAATEGEQVVFDDGDTQREVRVDVVGYAGHNRLMDDVELPEVREGERKPIRSFVLACYSHSYFTKALTEAGSTPLTMTKTLMAPEGYVVEAASRAVAEKDTRPELRERVVRAYAHWQKTTYSTASRVFVDLDD